MTRAMLTAVLLTVLSPASAHPQSSTAESQVTATLIAMWDAIEREDLDAYADYIHPDFTSFGEGDAYLNEGKDLELRSTAEWLSRVDGVHTDMHQPRVTVRGDVAWITYYWSDYGYRADGTRFSSRGKSTRIFVLEDGHWLCIHGHYTEIP